MAMQLSGAIIPGGVHGQCVTDVHNGYQWYFSVRNVGKTGQTVTKETIEGYLRREIGGCGLKGGFSTVDRIQYK